MEIALTILAILLVVIGLAGTVLPALPGVPLIFGGLLLIAYQDGFNKVGVVTLIILGVLSVLAVAIDYIAAIFGAKRVGASRLALIGATVGTIAGLFLGFVALSSDHSRAPLSVNSSREKMQFKRAKLASQHGSASLLALQQNSVSHF